MRATPIRALMLALLLSACAHDSENGRGEARVDQPGQYMPLAVGNHWTYSMSFLGQQREQRVEVVGAAQNRFEVKDSSGIPRHVSVDAYGVRDETAVPGNADPNTPAGMPVTRYLLRDPIEVGAAWTNVVSPQAAEHYKIIEVGQSCEVPAGRFQRCVRVEARLREGEVTMVNEMTFAMGAGLVRTETFVETPGAKRIPQTKMELKEFQLARR